MQNFRVDALVAQLYPDAGKAEVRQVVKVLEDLGQRVVRRALG